MKRPLTMLFALLLVVPVAAQAQVDIGVDGGVVYDMESDLDTEFGTIEGENQTTFTFPAPWLRLGIAASEALSVETVLAFDRASDDDGAFTTLVLLPGVNFTLGEGGFYVRAEGGLLRNSYSPSEGDGDSQTRYSLGAAAGLRTPIADTPVAFRVEAGVGRWFEDEEAFDPAVTRIRILVGISAALN